MERVYLDWNASAPLRPQARAAMSEALIAAGNPSSVHSEGRFARRLIEEARAQVAALVGAEPGHVIFTSGGTEANMLALTPAIECAGDKRPRERLLISAIEHPSVRTGGRFSPGTVEEIVVTGEGLIDLDALRAALGRDGRALVSVMLANNETGAVQPICEIAQVVHEAGGILHVDAVQGVGKIHIDINTLGADLLSLSAHKIGGPKGVGALVRRTAHLHLSAPFLMGGGQEHGLRAGTENVIGISGFGAAAQASAAALSTEADSVALLHRHLENGLRAATPDLVIFSDRVERVVNTTLFSFPGMRAETAVIAFDLAGIAVSSGAACSSGKVQPSHVLAAMGVEPALARGAIRVSLGFSTTEADIERFLGAWIRLSESLGKRRSGLAA